MRTKPDPATPPGMIYVLRALFVVILIAMIAVTTWASRQTSLFAIPSEVARHPWFLATLCDAYFAFIAVFTWVAWKERSLGARGLWLISLLALGNIAVAAYFLRELFTVSPRDGLDPVFTRRNPGTLLLPALLTAGTIVVYLLA